jgi:hypothetical protein
VYTDLVVPLQQFIPAVLAEIVRHQPPSTARTAFAWQLAVGQALARVTAVDLRDGTLFVRPRDARWAPEIARAAGTILPRMQHLLGTSTVWRIEVEASSEGPS